MRVRKRNGGGKRMERERGKEAGGREKERGNEELYTCIKECYSNINFAGAWNTWIT